MADNHGQNIHSCAMTALLWATCDNSERRAGFSALCLAFFHPPSTAYIPLAFPRPARGVGTEVPALWSCCVVPAAAWDRALPPHLPQAGPWLTPLHFAVQQPRKDMRVSIPLCLSHSPHGPLPSSSPFPGPSDRAGAGSGVFIVLQNSSCKRQWLNGCRSQGWK